jgi:Cof subfamily protein (haloacid dehalogenase superfamily)
MPHYRLIAIDIDGTLLDSRSELRPAARDAVRRAVEAGLLVLLSTGRRYRTALEIAHEIGLPLPLVCHSGALVKDTGTHATLLAHPIPRPDLELLLSAFAEQQLTPLVYTDTFESGIDFYVQQGAPLTRFHEDYLSKNDGWFRAVASLPDGLPADAVQTCTFAEIDRLRAARPTITERLGGRTTCHLLHSAKYLGHFLEFQAGTASKWAAITELARAHGIPHEEIVAIGDDENDISMLRAAGLGVAMGNASYRVKSAAHVVTASNDEGGVARVIEMVLADHDA